MSGETGVAVINGEGAGAASPWEFDSVVENGTATLTLLAAAAHHEKYGYRYSFGTNGAIGIKAITAIPGEAYARIYFKISSDWTQGNNGQTDLGILFDTNETRALVKIKLVYHSGAGDFGCAAYVLHGAGSHTAFWFATGSSIFQKDTLHYVDIHYKVHATAGGAAIWVDGVLKASNYTRDTSNFEIDTIGAGVIDTPFYDPTAGTIDFDDSIVRETGPIGAYTGPIWGADGDDVDDVSPWEWTTINNGGDNVFSLQSAAKYQGTHGYRGLIGSAGSPICSGKVTSIGDLNEFYLRVRFNIVSMLQATGTGALPLIRLYNSASGLLGWVALYEQTEDTQDWGFMYRMYGTAWETIVDKSTEEMFRGAGWHWFEAYWKYGLGSTGFGELWFDGKSMGDKVLDSRSGWYLDQIEIGSPSVASAWTNGDSFYVDEIVLNNEPIGPYGGGSFRERARRYLFTGGPG